MESEFFLSHYFITPEHSRNAEKYTFCSGSVYFKYNSGS